jgi:hypothetical protein
LDAAAAAAAAAAAGLVVTESVSLPRTTLQVAGVWVEHLLRARRARLLGCLRHAALAPSSAESVELSVELSTAVEDTSAQSAHSGERVPDAAGSAPAFRAARAELLCEIREWMELAPFYRSCAACYAVLNGAQDSARAAEEAAGAFIKPSSLKVRKTTSWPRSWANFSLFTAVFPQDYNHGPACNVWANLTPSSLQSSVR